MQSSDARRARRTLLKACPRCQGDLFWREDLSGDEELHCLQCGRAFAPALVLGRAQIA
ncbi:MAG: hypothetical protein HYU88_07565 [Chloroflexi bacterium]|nr:hypothetical protein [Chloroflexota bacterium]MBI4506117.1 hypothetical protein [Chloroflexota bacterium]